MIGLPESSEEMSLLLYLYRRPKPGLRMEVGSLAERWHVPLALKRKVVQLVCV